MGINTDIDDILVKSTREKRQKWLWAIVTSVGTIIGSTATVSWQMGHYIAKAEAKDNELRGQILVQDKKIEKLEALEDKVGLAQATADKALLYAQLTGQKNGVVKP